MTIALWPPETELPQTVLAPDFAESVGDGRLRTPMDAGPPKVRMEFSLVPELLTLSFKVTLDQKERLKRFWYEEIAQGTLPFLFPTPGLHGALLLDQGDLLRTETGAPILIASWDLLLVSERVLSFKPQERGLSYIASFSVLRMP